MVKKTARRSSLTFVTPGPVFMIDIHRTSCEAIHLLNPTHLSTMQLYKRESKDVAFLISVNKSQTLTRCGDLKER
jgi:hypothetical protein